MMRTSLALLGIAAVLTFSSHACAQRIFDETLESIPNARNPFQIFGTPGVAVGSGIDGRRNTDSLFELDGVSLGGKVIVPTSNNPPLFQAGGGITIGLEGKPWRVDQRAGAFVAPIINLEIFGQGFNKGAQANLIGGNNMTSNGFIGAGFQPGLRWHWGLGNRTNLFFNCGGHLRYANTNLTFERFDWRKIQVPVVKFTESDWTFGYFAGGGLEFLHRNHLIRTGVDLESYSTDIVTGQKRQETQLGIVVEVVRRRDPTRNVIIEQLLDPFLDY